MLHNYKVAYVAKTSCNHKVGGYIYLYIYVLIYILDILVCNQPLARPTAILKLS